MSKIDIPFQSNTIQSGTTGNQMPTAHVPTNYGVANWWDSNTPRTTLPSTFVDVHGRPLFSTENKAHVKATELEAKLDTLANKVGALADENRIQKVSQNGSNVEVLKTRGDTTEITIPANSNIILSATYDTSAFSRISIITYQSSSFDYSIEARWNATAQTVLISRGVNPNKVGEVQVNGTELQIRIYNYGSTDQNLSFCLFGHRN